MRQRSVSLARGLAPLILVLSLGACGDRDRAAAPSNAPLPSGAPPANTAAPATSAPPPGAAESQAASDTRPDTAALATAAAREFLVMAASNGVFEVDAGRLALERSKDSEVRAFAERLVQDHTQANEQLKVVAGRAGLADAPAGMVAMHRAQLESLRALDGRAFDREFAAQAGVAAHSEAVAIFERAAREVSIADVRAFAEAALPALREHLKAAHSLAQAVGVPAERTKTATEPPDAAASKTMDAKGASSSSGAGTRPPEAASK
jgi:putative membrane protein